MHKNYFIFLEKSKLKRASDQTWQLRQRLAPGALASSKCSWGRLAQGRDRCLHLRRAASLQARTSRVWPPGKLLWTNWQMLPIGQLLMASFCQNLKRLNEHKLNKSREYTGFFLDISKKTQAQKNSKLKENPEKNSSKIPKKLKNWQLQLSWTAGKASKK